MFIANAGKKGGKPVMADAKIIAQTNQTKKLASIRKKLFQRLSRDNVGYVLIVLTFVLGFTVFLSLSTVSDISTQSNFLSAAIFLAIMLLLILAFFVGRQLLRLWQERKRRLAGAQLHLRLVMLFLSQLFHLFW